MGERAKTMGRAKDETTIPVVMKIANSKQGLLLLPEDSISEYRRAMRVGIGANM